MTIKKNSIVTISESEKYLIMERTTFMGTEYFLGCLLDSYGNPKPDSNEILYVETEEEYDPDIEDFIVRREEKISFVEDNELEELLWMLFEEQREIGDV